MLCILFSSRILIKINKVIKLTIISSLPGAHGTMNSSSKFSPDKGVRDMTEISNIDELGINRNLKVRYDRDEIYVSFFERKDINTFFYRTGMGPHFLFPWDYSLIKTQFHLHTCSDPESHLFVGVQINTQGVRWLRSFLYRWWMRKSFNQRDNLPR